MCFSAALGSVSTFVWKRLPRIGLPFEEKASYGALSHVPPRHSVGEVCLFSLHLTHEPGVEN